MSKQEKIEKKKLQEIELHLNQAKDSIRKAMEIADKHGIEFRWTHPGMDHGEGSGMGGWYFGKGNPEREKSKSGDYAYPGPDGWLASSRSC